MLEFSVDDCAKLKLVIEAVGLVCQEANLDCTPNGVSLSGMDSGHVSLAKLELKPNFFTEYRCDAACTLGLHFTTLTKVMRCCERSEKVTFSHKNNSDELTIKRETLEDNCKPATYNIKLIRLDAERLEIKEFDDGISFDTGSNQLQKIIRELSIFSDDIVFECPYIENQKERYVKIMASGDIGQGSQILRDTSFIASAVDIKKDPEFQNGAATQKRKKAKKIKNEDGEMVDDPYLDSDDEDKEKKERKIVPTTVNYCKNFVLADSKCSEGQGLRMTYAAQYLNVFCRAQNLSEQVTVTISKNPIQMEYFIGDFGRVSFHLAPRYTDEAMSQE